MILLGSFYHDCASNQVSRTLHMHLSGSAPVYSIMQSENTTVQACKVPLVLCFMHPLLRDATVGN